MRQLFVLLTAIVVLWAFARPASAADLKRIEYASDFSRVDSITFAAHEGVPETLTFVNTQYDLIIGSKQVTPRELFNWIDKQEGGVRVSPRNGVLVFNNATTTARCPCAYCPCTIGRECTCDAACECPNCPSRPKPPR